MSLPASVGGSFKFNEMTETKESLLWEYLSICRYRHPYFPGSPHWKIHRPNSDRLTSHVPFQSTESSSKVNGYSLGYSASKIGLQLAGASHCALRRSEEEGYEPTARKRRRQRRLSEEARTNGEGLPRITAKGSVVGDGSVRSLPRVVASRRRSAGRSLSVS